ncbi:heat shock protein Sti1p [Trichomonascus vanleenenianus]|uniref:Hsp90 cochaperone STI1 n=1 Tax=Trichomonascus vanleenenianus TaxID=2268995 RepID=UPI003ECB12A5
MSEADKFKAEGNAAFSAKDFTKAVEMFTKAIEASETPNHVLYSNRSAAYSSMRQYDQALKDAQECVKINPQWSKGYGRVGAAQFGLGDLVAAKDAYEEALKIDPNNAQAKSGLDSVLGAIDREAAADGTSADMGMGDIFKDPAIWTKLATNPKTREFANDPSFVEKIKQMQTNPMAVLSGAQQDPRLMTAISVILGIDLPTRPGQEEDTAMPDAPQPEKKEPPKKEEPKKEEPKKEEPVDEDKAKADEEKALGNTLYKQRKFDEAIEHYNKAWELKKDITYLNNRAAAEYEKGDFDGAVATCTKAIEYGREVFADYKLLAKTYARLGSTYLKKDDYKSAIEAFNKSLTEHRTPDTLNKLRQAEKDLKKREAEEYIDPVKADEAREAGNAKLKAGDLPEAVKDYTEAIKRAPEDPRGYGNRAVAYLKLMNYPDVVKDCDTAISKDPTFFKAYTRKATAQMIMRQYKECIDTLEKAREIDTEGKHTREIEDIYMKAATSRFQHVEGETPEQTLERVSRDPEVAEILQDPIMNSILQQAQNNPAALRDHMKNPEIARKVNLLIAAGVIRTR